jgi:hypothetical protein
MKDSFGNIKDTTLEEAINKPGFKKYWNITKDEITNARIVSSGIFVRIAGLMLKILKIYIRLRLNAVMTLIPANGKNGVQTH